MTNKIFILLVIFISVLIFPFSLISNDEQTLDLRIVPKEDFKEIFSDSAVTIIDEKTDETYVNKFYGDGTVTSKRKDNKWKGVWFADQKGRHCIRWDHRDKSNCGYIMQDDDGNWIKVKDDEVIKRYEKFDDLPALGSELPDLGSSRK